jgi:hypothetical protein
MTVVDCHLKIKFVSSSEARSTQINTVINITEN